MAKVRKAVITAAGRGTRQYPATSVIQKEMIPLVDRDGLTKPILQIIIEECIESGIEEICVVTGPGEQHIYTDYFKRLGDEEVKRFRGKDWAILESRKSSAASATACTSPSRRRPRASATPSTRRRILWAASRSCCCWATTSTSADVKDRCVRQLINVFERYMLEAVSGVQPTLERDLYLFGTIKGAPIEPDKGIYKAELIIEKPDVQTARERLVTPGLPAGNYLAHFGIHVFGPRIFDSLQYHIENDIRSKGEIQFTTAQEHLRENSDKYWAVVNSGQRYDTGIPYGLMETQLALSLNGLYRKEMCEAIARTLATQVRG